ncbi:sigma-70 family RNA polymerase sigma factor [bacterium]|nr:sigma-70 family RNA polymerase sigma factor [bacterium]
MERARSGDQAAFSELVWRHQDAMFTLATRLVGPDLAPDVTQEALLRAWRALPKFRGEARFSTWLHRITVNAAWTQRKRAARHEAVPLIEDTHEDTAPGPEFAGEMVDVRAGLREAIESLSDGQRAVVVLRDVYGWTNQEVADELDITRTTAKVRLHRARMKLREILEEAS